MKENLIANTTLSHYRIVKQLGAGGMGEVYLAEDTRLRRKVALKVLPTEIAQDTDRLRRFEQEAFAASALNHPNILTIHEFGVEGETHFIVSEFIDGETLRARLARAPLTLNEALDIAVQTAQALSAAHEAKIIHRDIKPENVMVRRDGIVKVLDFGLAKLTAKPAAPAQDSDAPTALKPNTDPGTVMGTASYMSPEQARGQEVDARTDIFSLGVVLYETLAGRPPFEGVNALDVISAILQTEPAPLTEHLAEAPRELEHLLSKALRKDREQRYQTVKDLLIDLKDLKEELAFAAKQARSGLAERKEPVTAPAEVIPTSQVPAAPTTSSARIILGEIQRHKLGVTLMLVLLLAAVAALGYFAFLARPASGPIESLAVLPFQNRSASADSEYLSDGLAESLIYRLSQLPHLKVSPTSSVLRYKGRETDPIKVGKELGVQAVMSGRMVQRGENLTISVELVDVRHNKLLWGEQYERKLSDLLATQREIAAEITNKLQLKLSGADEAKVTKNFTINAEAYQLYLKGRFYWNKRDEENLRKAIEQFKAAADKDPNYALAFVGLADSYVLLPYYSSVPSNDVLPQARAYAERALEIDDSLGEAHTSLGYVNRLLWKWAEAEKELKRGIELSPNYATAHKFYGNMLSDLGRMDESLAAYKRAQELEPLSLIISINLAEVHLQKGDLKAAVEQCQRAIDLDPHWYYARLQLALAYLRQGRNAEALSEAEKSVELSQRLSGSLGVLGHVYAQTGKHSEAAAVIEELKKRYAKGQANAYDLARVYVGLGEKDQAITWLEKDYQSRNATMPSFLYFPPLDSLRDDPRYKDLVRRVGLPELK